MDKYKNGKIYTIRYKNDDSLIYVGSTVQPLYKRFSQHKIDSKTQRLENMNLYQKFNETDINDWYIELYEDCPCERKEQLLKREGEVIREIGTLNKKLESTTIEHKKAWFKEYGSELVFCECGCSCRKDNLVRHMKSQKHINIMKTILTQATCRSSS
jgi:hypothetical protein